MHVLISFYLLRDVKLLELKIKKVLPGRDKQTTW